MNNFLFLGGDLRFIYAAERLNKKYDISVYGFDERIEPCGVPVLKELQKCGNLVLPLPASYDSENITAPYFSKKLPLSLVPKAVEKGGTVYCGKATPALREICEENGLKLVDYFEREELIVMNAVPTAEGALEIIMRESPTTIMGMKILITGYGRIAKVLAKYLVALGAKVTVCARRYSDLSWAEIAGCSSIHLSKLDSVLPQFDTIVNTVPAPLFDRERLLAIKNECLVVDLASKTSVSDMELAKNVGVKVIWALSLPGKVAPITAGQIIASAILNIIAEQQLGGEPPQAFPASQTLSSSQPSLLAGAKVDLEKGEPPRAFPESTNLGGAKND